MLGAIGACSSDAESGGDTSIQAANVRVTLMDASGNQKGTCSGVLLNSTSVLLPAHCVVGKAKWKVLSPASGFSSSAEVAYTYDWNDYKTNASRPDRHDIAVLRLDTKIEIQEYPKLATYPMTSKSDAALRMHASGDSFDTIPSQVTMASTKGFKYSYTTKMAADESLDTGGAIFGADGKTLYGIVSGKGTKSGLLYVSRADSLIDWLSAKSSCGGVRMANTACAKDAGVCLKDSGSGSTSTPTDSGSAGKDSGSSSSGSGGSGSGGSGSGSAGSGSGGSGSGSSGASCGETPGICWGNCGSTVGGGASGGAAAGGDGSGGSGSGSAGTGSGGSGTGGGTGTGGGSGTGTGGTGGDGTGGSGSGSAGTGSGGSGSGSGGGSSYGDGTGGTGSGAASQGPGGCDGYPNCVDDVVDYGDCGCYGSNDSYNIK
jgi:hypothetical protein